MIVNWCLEENFPKYFFSCCSICNLGKWLIRSSGTKIKAKKSVMLYGQFITLGSTQKFGGQSKNIHARVGDSSKVRKKYNIIYIDL